MNSKGIIAAAFILGFLAILIMVLTTFAWLHRKSSNNTTDADEKTERISPLFIPDRIYRHFTVKRGRGRGQLVPTLSGIIKAGDEGVYSSALWNGMHRHTGDMTLEMLYGVFERASKKQTMVEKSAYPIRSFSGESNTLKRRKSLGIPREGRYEFQPRFQRSSMDVLERGLIRSKSRRSAPILVSMVGALDQDTGTQSTTASWTKDVQHAHYFLGQTGVNVTAAEFVALGLILGCLPYSAEQSEQSYDFSKGAFGVSMSSKIAGELKRHIRLVRHKRPLSHLPGKGSGYSAVFAKHLPFGSLPYSQTPTSINAILVNASTLQALQTQTPLHLQDTESQTSSSTFLSSLPSSRKTALHTLTPLPTYAPSEPPTVLLNAIVSLPFTGGLVPIASTPIIATVHFISSAGLPAGRLLQRLDALVEKVHRHSPHLHLFGPLLESGNAGLLFRERERLGRLATGAAVEDTVGAKAARVQRYKTLIERLMALVPGMNAEEVLGAVKQALKSEIERSYDDAVAAVRDGDDQEPTLGTSKRNSGLFNERRKSKRKSSSSTAATMPAQHTSGHGLPTLAHGATVPVLGQHATSPSPTSPSVNSPRTSSTFARPNLGQQVEQLLKLNLPLDVQSIARLVRLVLVAWTVSVEHVEPEQLVLDGSEKFVLF